MALPRTINIVVIGTHESGKRTFINSIREPETYDGGLVPASSYFGRVRLTPDITLFLFPTGGSRPLKIITTILDQTFMGAVVVIDSTRPETFAEARTVIRNLLTEGIPLVLVANKQDLPDAWSLDDLRIALRLEDVPLLPCRAKERESVKTVLERLFSEILDSLSPQTVTPTQRFVPPPAPVPPPSDPPAPRRPQIKPLTGQLRAKK